MMANISLMMVHTHERLQTSRGILCSTVLKLTNSNSNLIVYGSLVTVDLLHVFFRGNRVVKNLHVEGQESTELVLLKND